MISLLQNLPKPQRNFWSSVQFSPSENMFNWLNHGGLSIYSHKFDSCITFFFRDVIVASRDTWHIFCKLITSFNSSFLSSSAFKIVACIALIFNSRVWFSSWILANFSRISVVLTSWEWFFSQSLQYQCSSFAASKKKS